MLFVNLFIIIIIRLFQKNLVESKNIVNNLETILGRESMYF